MDSGSTAKIYSYAVFVLVCGQNLVNHYRDKFSGIVKESESYGRDFSVCVGAGNHLYGYIYAKYAFHESYILSAKLRFFKQQNRGVK